jgi:hypothetical protein
METQRFIVEGLRTNEQLSDNEEPVLVERSDCALIHHLLLIRESQIQVRRRRVWVHLENHA